MPASSSSTSVSLLLPAAAREATSTSRLLASSTATASAARANSRQLVPLLGLLRQRACEHGIQSRRDVGLLRWPAAAPSRGGRKDHGELELWRKGWLPDEALVEDVQPSE